jgi:2-oxoglutarate ferredoxin oxidoreductase subunit gamma
MANLIQIRLCGYGGQGVILAGIILGHAAIHDDQWVAGSNSYGAQARGGAARSEVVIAKHPIAYPHVLQADILIAMSQTAYDTYIHEVTEGNARILYDDMMVKPRTMQGIQHMGIPAIKTAISKLDANQVANIIMLGASAVVTGIVTEKSLISSIQAHVSQRFKELNIKALRAGFTIGEKLT